MKIGMILDGGFPPDPRVENEAVCLIEDKHEVFLYCVDYTHSRPAEEVINGIKVHRVRLPKHLYSLSALAYTIPYYHFFLMPSICRFIKKFQIEMLHIHDMQSARSVFWVNRFFKLPVVLDLHENRPEIMKFYHHVKSGLGKLLICPNNWRKHEFRYIKKADFVLTVTKDAADYYQSQTGVGADKFFVMSNTVQKSFYQDYKVDNDILSSFKDSFTLLYIGETSIRRGLLTVLQSLKFLIPVIDNIKILIVGKSKDDHVLKEFVAENNYNEYVEFAGWQDFALFQSFILAADVGLCPFQKNKHHDTTLANKLFQYMAFGKPVIVSNCTSQQRLVEKHECGLVFQDGNAKDFAEKVISLAKDRSLYEKLSTNAENAVEDNFNWEKTSSNLKNIYNIERNKTEQHLQNALDLNHS